MSSTLSFILLLLALAGIVIGLINAVRKFKNQFIKLRWILLPLIFSSVILLFDLYAGNLEWIINGQSTKGQSSLKIENKELKNTSKKKRIGKKTNGKNEIKESQNSENNLGTDNPESEQKEKELSARFITAVQTNKFVNFLNDKPKGSVTIKYVAGDVEAFEYSKNIADMLVKAGYNLPGRISNFAGNEAVAGISIVINSDETQPVYAKSIFTAFRLIGINIQAERDKKLVRPLEVLITVGHNN